MLEERGEVEEEGLDVRLLAERAAQHLDSLASWIGIARAQPTMAGDASTAVALADERDRLLGAQQRRGLAVKHLKLLPPQQAAVVRLLKQPLRAQELDVAAIKRPNQAVVKRGESLVDL